MRSIQSLNGPLGQARNKCATPTQAAPRRDAVHLRYVPKFEFQWMPTTIAGFTKQHKLGDIKLHRVISIIKLLHSNIIMTNTNGKKG
jgi:hypothetical protein